LVLRRAKIPVRSVFIGHIDNSFVLKRPGEFAGLKAEVDVTDAVEAMLSDIADESSTLLDVMSTSAMPAIPMGDHCMAPYECAFMKRCSKGMPPGPEYPVGLLPRGAKQAAALRAAGYADLRDVPAAAIERESHQRIYAATVSGVPYLDPAAAVQLNAFPYPRSYLDFETINFAVPEVVGTRPYEQWPFQFSLHIEDAPGQVRHLERLAIDDFADFERMVRALVDGIPKSGPVFVYSAAMEKHVLQRLADRLPAYRDGLLGIIGRLFDLLPLTQASYYHPAMKGSWSIKAVLPTIDPSLGYDTLDGIAGGVDAQVGFLEARDPKTPQARKERIIAELRAYCHRDTWGMVVLRRFLSGEA
jgi:Domain of unknown function(DUF2779)